MYIPLGIKTDYSLLSSLIKINDLMDVLKENDITTCGILDNNLFGSMCFYDTCKKNNIKPIIGLIVKLGDYKFYLYAKNYNGYKNLLKVNTLIQKDIISYVNLNTINDDIICVVPYKSKDIFKELTKIYKDIYIGYSNDYSKSNGALISENKVYVNEICAYTFDEIKYLKLLREMDGEEVDLNLYSDSYLIKEVPKDYINSTIEFSNLINIEIPKSGRYIPHYDNNISDSYAYLVSLCKKGLNRRLNDNVQDNYINRLSYELDVIKSMGFVDYFLIVYDYVKYAKQNDIYVGPGRGSAAGSLVSYCLGITNIDPIKYNLLFERFLNPERITMPDIDIDFEDNRRDDVIKYVKSKYGENNVSNIMTFGTLTSRQVIRDVGKCLKADSRLIDRLCNLMDSDSKISLKSNLEKDSVKDFVNSNNILKKVYKVSFKLEGLKRHISTHAAGVVICSVALDDVIPICISNGDILTGCTAEYLEELGLLKMDFLALRNLSVIHNVVSLIEKSYGKKINLNNIPLDDEKTLNIFRNVDTEGIFQFESPGMKNLLSKLKVDNFLDLGAALALFRPGPMGNIDNYIARKKGIEKIDTFDDSLNDILSDTYGIMIYQEQIMQILVRMADYSFAEADNIRRAMSKKKIDIMENNREIFINRSVKKGYSKEKAIQIYELIIKFASYGFNKAHSISYAMISYQMAYLKGNYPVYYMASLLNMVIGSDIKTKSYIDEAKRKDIKIFKPNINVSRDCYLIKDSSLLLPLNVIHNVGISSVIEIVEERDKNGKFIDFYNFVARCYGKGINRRIIESLIDADVFRDFGYNHKSLYESIDSALDYAILCNDLDESLVMKPNMVEDIEYDDNLLISKELECFGFYVTNHPASKYQDGIMKLKDIVNFFDKYVNLVVIIENVRKIKTKKGEDMGFFTASDETCDGEFTVFPKNNKLLDQIRRDDLVKVRGQVTRRNDKFQIIVSNIEKI